MQVVDCSEWAATLKVDEQLVVVEVPEGKREVARYSVDIRPYVQVRPPTVLPGDKLDHARDVAIVAMIRRQQDARH